MIKRDLESEIRSVLGKGKTIVIYGARQVGKTTLLKTIFSDQDGVLWLNGDDQSTQDSLSVASVEPLGELVRGYKTVIIDEAQRIENIGLKLKILHDNFSDKIQFIATGSSSFDLANKINEPMTGRKWTFWMPQLTTHELLAENGLANESGALDTHLVFGTYPAVITSTDFPAEQILSQLTTENLYKDILNFGDIIKTDKLSIILKALSLQVGSQVSMTELSNLVGIDRKTVDKYIALLEQAFIIFRLPSFSRNLRKELKFSQKIYFYDNGIRNALIGNYRPVNSRDDVGKLFENYIIAEFKKTHPNDNLYFWRNTDQQEIDLLIEKNGELTIIETKYSPDRKVKFPNSFTSEYLPAHTFAINRDNYTSLINDSTFGYLEN